jgi:hypothetical protein
VTDPLDIAAWELDRISSVEDAPAEEVLENLFSYFTPAMGEIPLARLVACI